MTLYASVAGRYRTSSTPSKKVSTTSKVRAPRTITSKTPPTVGLKRSHTHLPPKNTCVLTKNWRSGARWRPKLRKKCVEWPNIWKTWWTTTSVKSMTRKTLALVWRASSARKNSNWPWSVTVTSRRGQETNELRESIRHKSKSCWRWRIVRRTSGLVHPL